MLHYVSRAIGRTIEVRGLHAEHTVRQVTNLPKRTHTRDQVGLALKSAGFVERKTQKSAIESGKQSNDSSFDVRSGYPPGYVNDRSNLFYNE